MKRPAVFFDRDNTLIAGNDFLGDPAGVVLVPGAAAAVARARRLGYATVVISNQSGVARGLFDEAAVHAVNQRMDQLLLADDPAAVIDRHEFCPFHPEGTVPEYKLDSPLRKPKPGMILQAADMLALDLRRSWVIGDAPRDIDAGHAAGCRTILFTDPTLPASPAAGANGAAKPDFAVQTLKDALDAIEKHPDPPLRIAAVPESAVAAALVGAPSTGAPASSETAPRGSMAIATKPSAPVEPLKISGSTQSPARPAPPAIKPTVATPARLTSEAPKSPAPAALSTARIEAQLDQLLTELRRSDVEEDEFSVSKLLAGVVQVLAIGVVFLAYLKREDPPETFIGLLLFAVFLQVLTVAMLIMGRQR